MFSKVKTLAMQKYYKKKLSNSPPVIENKSKEIIFNYLEVFNPHSVFPLVHLTKSQQTQTLIKQMTSKIKTLAI